MTEQGEIREELHPEYSDGYYEEEEAQQPPETTGNRVIRFFKYLGHKIYRGMYCTGGFFADLFGITSPRYGYIIREYEQRMREQREQERAAAGVTNEEEDEELHDIERPREIQDGEMNAKADDDHV